MIVRRGRPWGPVAEGPGALLAEELRRLSGQGRVSLRELERLTGYSRATLSRVFNGHKIPDHQMVDGLIRVFGEPANGLAALRDQAIREKNEVKPNISSPMPDLPGARVVTVALLSALPVVIDGMKAWLEGELQGGLLVVHTSDSAADLISGGEDIDVIVADATLSRKDPSYITLRTLISRGYRIVVFSDAAAHSAETRRLLRMGVAAFVSYNEDREHLIGAIRAAAAGRPYTSPSAALTILSDVERSALLSDQELIALKQWVQSKSIRLVAHSMGVSPSTARTFIDRAREKYEAVGRPAPTKSDLIKRALEDGLLSLDDIGSY